MAEGAACGPGQSVTVFFVGLFTLEFTLGVFTLPVITWDHDGKKMWANELNGDSKPQCYIYMFYIPTINILSIFSSKWAL